jgi:hypothetical protein
VKRDAADITREEGPGALRVAFDRMVQEQHVTLARTEEVFKKWLALTDLTPVYAVLGAVAANLLPGDPVWLGLIGPPSSAKTEILNSTARLPKLVQAATLTPAGLLSGTPRRQQSKGAKGGLLMQIGDFGIIALKDFGSILSMRPEPKAEVLAALREIYDGSWTRHLGSDGGRTLPWAGKIGLIFCATEAYDAHYSVIGSLGDRFLLCRLKPADTAKQFEMALKHTGEATKTMRTELATVVASLFGRSLRQPRPLAKDEYERLKEVVTLVVRLRGTVERDPRTREIEAVYGTEGPGRLALTLERLLLGLDTLGLDRSAAFAVVEHVAMSSTPPIRLKAFNALSETCTTREMAEKLGLPTTTTRRALEELTAHGLLTRGKDGREDFWSRTNAGSPNERRNTNEHRN